jgi:Holliday junction resolvase
MRRAAKIDRTQPEIVEALRKAGATVQSLAAVGAGVPDLLCGWHGMTLLIECKDGALPPSGQSLTPDQVAWHSAWRGRPVWVIRSAEEALAALKSEC